LQSIDMFEIGSRHILQLGYTDIAELAHELFKRRRAQRQIKMPGQRVNDENTSAQRTQIPFIDVAA